MPLIGNGMAMRVMGLMSETVKRIQHWSEDDIAPITQWLRALCDIARFDIPVTIRMNSFIEPRPRAAISVHYARSNLGPVTIAGGRLATHLANRFDLSVFRGWQVGLRTDGETTFRQPLDITLLEHDPSWRSNHQRRRSLAHPEIEEMRACLRITQRGRQECRKGRAQALAV